MVALLFGFQLQELLKQLFEKQPQFVTRLLKEDLDRESLMRIGEEVSWGRNGVSAPLWKSDRVFEGDVPRPGGSVGTNQQIGPGVVRDSILLLLPWRIPLEIGDGGLSGVVPGR